MKAVILFLFSSAGTAYDEHTIPQLTGPLPEFIESTGGNSQARSCRNRPRGGTVQWNELPYFLVW